MNNRILFQVCSSLATCCVLLVGDMTVSLAQSNAVQDGNWSAPATWDPAEPTAATQTFINGSITVDIDQAGEVAGILDLGTVASEAGNLTIAAPGALTLGTAMRVGQSAGSTGNVTMTGGTVVVNGAVGSGFADGDLIVGDVGDGTLAQSGGDIDVTDEIIIGLADGSTGLVNVSGGNFRSVGRSILVGFDGNGTLEVSDTGNVRANFDMLVGFLPGSVGTVNLSGGTIEAGFLFTNIDGDPAGSTAFINQTGGTFTTRIAFVLGQRAGTTMMTHSGGQINVLLGPGEFVVGDGAANSSTYNISGTASVDILSNLVVGRDGIGVVNMTGGTINTSNVYLGDFDTSSGTMTISGGTLNLTGNLSVGGALASNAAAFPPGFAFDADGSLAVSGSGGAINVGGNLLANGSENPRNDASGANNSNLLFEVLDNSGISTINVTGLADLTGAVIDFDLLGGTFPLGTTFDLINATTISNDYVQIAEDVGDFALSIVPASGGGQILRVTLVPEPSTFALIALASVGLIIHWPRSSNANHLS